MKIATSDLFAYRMEYRRLLHFLLMYFRRVKNRRKNYQRHNQHQEVTVVEQQNVWII